SAVIFIRLFRIKQNLFEQSEFILFRNKRRKIAERYSVMTFASFFQEKEDKILICNMQNKYGIIIAGCTGSRMNSDLQKQFLLLEDRLLDMHTLEKFANSKSKPQLILVLHPDMFSVREDLCRSHHFEIPHSVIAGGYARFRSVRNGIDYIANHQPGLLENTLIAFHDTARPVGTHTIIYN